MAIFSLTPDSSRATKTPRDIHVTDVAREVQMTAAHAPLCTDQHPMEWRTLGHRSRHRDHGPHGRKRRTDRPRTRREPRCTTVADGAGTGGAGAARRGDGRPSSRRDGDVLVAGRSSRTGGTYCCGCCGCTLTRGRSSKPPTRRRRHSLRSHRVATRGKRSDQWRPQTIDEGTPKHSISPLITSAKKRRALRGLVPTVIMSCPAECCFTTCTKSSSDDLRNVRPVLTHRLTGSRGLLHARAR